MVGKDKFKWDISFYRDTICYQQDEIERLNQNIKELKEESISKLILIDKDVAKQEYKDNCIKYVNGHIHDANLRYQNNTDIRREYIYQELEDQLRKSYEVLVDNHNSDYLIISWE